MIGSTPARDAVVCLFVTFLIISHSSVQHVSSLLQEHKFVNLNKINRVPVSKGLTFPQGKWGERILWRTCLEMAQNIFGYSTFTKLSQDKTKQSKKPCWPHIKITCFKRPRDKSRFSILNRQNWCTVSHNINKTLPLGTHFPAPSLGRLVIYESCLTTPLNLKWFFWVLWILCQRLLMTSHLSLFSKLPQVLLSCSHSVVSPSSSTWSISFCMHYLASMAIAQILLSCQFVISIS